MKRPPNLLSAEQNQFFDDRIIYWQDRLGLNDWRIVRSRRKTKHMSDIKPDSTHRLATYATGDFGNCEEITPELIDSTALHEMLHVLLWEFRQTMIESDNEDLRMAAEHRVIITLERLLAGRT